MKDRRLLRLAAVSCFVYVLASSAAWGWTPPKSMLPNTSLRPPVPSPSAPSSQGAPAVSGSTAAPSGLSAGSTFGTVPLTSITPANRGTTVAAPMLASASGASYGLADCCTGNNAAFESYYSNYWFQQLLKTPAARGESSGVQLHYARFSTAYDTIAFYNGTGCSYSWDFLSDGGTDPSGNSAGGTSSAWYKLAVKLVDAKADGLIPLVVFNTATGDGQAGGTITSGAYHGYYPGVPQYPDTTSQAQELNYECNIDLLMYWTVEDGIPVGDWEAWNEPNLAGPIYNSPAGTGAGTGTWKAAYLWYVANAWAAYYQAQPGFPSESVAALTVNRASDTAYLDSYATNVVGIAHCTAGYQPSWGCYGSTRGFPTSSPTYWAVHDYDDPTIVAAGDLHAFLTDLAGKGLSPTPQVWVTEAGVQLDNQSTGDDNFATFLCNNGEADDTNTFGCAQDGTGSSYQISQYNGAQEWMSLGGSSSGSVTTTMVLWYMYQLQNFQHFWDSAMLDASGNGRPSYCALYGLPYTSCNASNTTDYESLGG